jgi:Na+/H+ antiporter NhaD/arsenite permease-like protein
MLNILWIILNLEGRSLVHRIGKKIMEELVFFISLILAIITSFIIKPKLEYIDFKVLSALFSLMIIIAAFEKIKFLDWIAIRILERFNNKQKVSMAIIIITFVSAMFITNDVALITFVPITIIIARKANINPAEIIIFQTLAANIGSALTPMGNPQNLFLYSFYRIDSIDFLKITALFVTVGLLWLYFINKKNEKDKLDFELELIKITDKNSMIIYTILFLIVSASILRIVDYRLALFITLLITIFLDRKLIKSIDYYLLATFLCFFIIVGNLSALDVVKDFMSSVLTDRYKVYLSAIFTSQFISNVPSAILLSAFTEQWKPLLLGVNIAGMGTLVASLASVISYKLYIKDYDTKGYLVKFHQYNFISLILFLIIFIFFI